MLSGASKEQISAVLLKLQGRATNYKDKYRDVGSVVLLLVLVYIFFYFITALTYLRPSNLDIYWY